jgi:hypothetical protein
VNDYMLGMFYLHLPHLEVRLLVIWQIILSSGVDLYFPHTLCLESSYDTWYWNVDSQQAIQSSTQRTWPESKPLSY